ncbi:FAD-dependent oxidoreductase, partial [Streptomyces bobili]|uniref:FAD-dependent oxidoreductase n=1 Tax=Streptomyces bobili TaxID=67280 RepID=UPI0033BF09BA
MSGQLRGTPDTVIVGAGLAGLACALDLCRAGRSVALLEASDGAGGRMRTDRRDGFLLDRGFQVFNTSYPQVKRRIDLRGLQLRPFTPGIIARTATGDVRLADPTRQPQAAASLLPGRVLPARDLAAMGALTARDALLPAALLKHRPDRPTAVALSRAGLSARTVSEILRPFLSGVFLEDRLETSARFFHLVWRSMVRGTLCLPAAGIGAVPAQLAGGLPEGVLQLETPVDMLTPEGVFALIDSFHADNLPPHVWAT